MPSADPSWPTNGDRRAVVVNSVSATDSARTIVPRDPSPSPSSSSSSSSEPLVDVATSPNPFVRSHAADLVHWHLLDARAISLARAENKLLFLHIGYAACHFSRLTTQDSFGHAGVADFLNTHFVPVLVDRDERPDLDRIYQDYNQAVNAPLAVQAAASGWPLHVFLTPELLPVFAGTYWPGPGTEHAAAFRHDAEGAEPFDFLTTVKRVHMSWLQQSGSLRAEARLAVEQLAVFAGEGVLGVRGAAPRRGTAAAAASSVPVPGDEDDEDDDEGIPVRLMDDVDLDLLEQAVSGLARGFDTKHGGFGDAPKYPLPPKLSFLLRLGAFPPEAQDVVDAENVRFARTMALHTLRRLRDGGLHDHIGGGFHRYSQTADWSLPRFEKMAIDNALLLHVFLDAWLGQSQHEGGGASLSQDDEFADVVFELADYLSCGPMALADGRHGFATSVAADSYVYRGDHDSYVFRGRRDYHAGREMAEGGSYLWTRREFNEVLRPDESSVAAAYFGVRVNGNIDRALDPHDEFLSQNVLQVSNTPAALARRFGMAEDEVRRVLGRARARLKSHGGGSSRARPAVDAKVVVCVNGAVIGALARAAGALQEVDLERAWSYREAAREAAEFLQERLWDEETRTLYRIYGHGRRGATRAFAEDYAYLIEGVLDLAESLRGSRYWITWACELQDRQIELFYDAPTRHDGPAVAPTPQHALSGGFYQTEADAPHVLLRLKEGMDADKPSTNAVSVANLFRLSRVAAGRAQQRRYALLARESVNAFEPELLQHPWLLPSLLAGVVAGRLGVDVDSRVLVLPRAQPRVGRAVEPEAEGRETNECQPSLGCFRPLCLEERAESRSGQIGPVGA
ncbi:hypothetical protein P8C59_009160 [Phyllachora maydis]|uniref:Spermatogenesis-associated protein 20-like TRX domain-containing protein n=1 Tax=Phyllachora maydis TaxID=1825666 RepID=A0AAD9ICL7_9PEZI|nr:hypothetical protein P8C59_009160 [Phyllachora maydis]